MSHHVNPRRGSYLGEEVQGQAGDKCRAAGKLKEKAELFPNIKCLAHETPPVLFYLDICVITPFKSCKTSTSGTALCKGKCTSLTAFKNTFENKQGWIETGGKNQREL